MSKADSPIWTSLVAVCAGGFLFQMDLTALAAITSDVSRDLRNSTLEAVWLIDAYSLALIFVVPIAGAAADRYGCRLLFKIGAGLFGLASIFCALSPNFGILLASRALQGISGALITSAGAGLLAKLYEGQARRQAFAWLGTTIGASMIAGPPLGSFLSQTVGWQSLFWINIPICSTIIILASGADAAKEARNQARYLDWLGSGLFALAVGFLCVAFLEIKSLRAAPVALVAIVILAAFSLLAFLVVERRQAYPALDLSLLKSRSFLAVSLAPVALSIGYWSLIVHVPQFARGPLQLSPQETGWLLTCLTLPMLLLPRTGARLAAHFPPGAFFAGGLLIIGLADIGLSIIAAKSGGVWQAIPALLAGGIGCALINAQISAAAVTVVPGERGAMAAAISVTMRQVGFAFGIAFLGFLLELSSYATAFAGVGILTLLGSASCLLLLAGRRTLSAS